MTRYLFLSVIFSTMFLYKLPPDHTVDSIMGGFFVAAALIGALKLFRMDK